MAWPMRPCDRVALGWFLVCPVLACTKNKESGGTTSNAGVSVAVVSETRNVLPRVDDYIGVDTVPHAGTLRGTVTYVGSKQPSKLSVTKDTKVCTHGDEADGSIQVANGKLKNAVVAIIDNIKQGKRWPSEKVVVDNKECLFEPRVQIAPSGGQVEAKNSDPLLHSANLAWAEGDQREPLANIPLPLQGRSQTKELKKSGFVEIKCDVHDWMKAWVYVSPHPYVALTGADGTYEIAGIPPGEYSAMVWHEELGRAPVKVKIDPDGAATLDHVFN
jgi:plastocyanin